MGLSVKITCDGGGDEHESEHEATLRVQSIVGFVSFRYRVLDRYSCDNPAHIGVVVSEALSKEGRRRAIEEAKVRHYHAGNKKIVSEEVKNERDWVFSSLEIDPLTVDDVGRATEAERQAAAS